MEGFEPAVDLSYKRNMTDVMMEIGRGQRLVGLRSQWKVRKERQSVSLKLCCGRRERLEMGVRSREGHQTEMFEGLSTGKSLAGA